METLKAHQEECVGMAANMIGVKKSIIVFDNEGTYMVMFNPKIVKKSEPFETEEGCLSLPEKPNGGNLSRFNMKMSSSSNASKPSMDGLPKLFSTNWITAQES